MREVLYIAAKAPRVGEVKTRLGRAIGHEAATALYTAFLRDLGLRFAAAPFGVGWYVTPHDGWAEVAPVVGATAHTPVVIQGAGDWTQRQRALFQGAAARGEERVVLIASDSPQVEVAVIAQAFRLLDDHPIVFGPVHDGGYYLIGMRGWHDVLQDVAMSSATVLDQLLAQAQRMGISVGLVEPTFDVDEAEDLARLRAVVAARADLVATAQALRELRIEKPQIGQHSA